MKKIFQLTFLLVALVSLSASTFAQKKIKEGVVKYELDMKEQDGAMAELGGTTLDFYFNDKMQRMDMKLMGGMMRIQTIIPFGNVKDAIMLMDMMGQKMQLIELEDKDLKASSNLLDVDGIAEVVYDENDKKEIAGYSCYKAQVKMDDKTEMTYYITEKIEPPIGTKSKEKTKLKGYPLQMIIDNQEIRMNFVATEVLGKLEKGAFDVPEGYTKMTMEEFQKLMGNMDLGN